MHDWRAETPYQCPIDAESVRPRGDENNRVHSRTQYSIQPQTVWSLCLHYACCHPTNPGPNSGQDYRADKPNNQQGLKVEVHRIGIVRASGPAATI